MSHAVEGAIEVEAPGMLVALYADVLRSTLGHPAMNRV
jgi:hypothetical protein